MLQGLSTNISPTLYYIFKHTAQLKELYSETSHTLHLCSTMYMHLSTHPSIHALPSIHPSTPHPSLPASTHPSAQLSIHPRGPSLLPTSPAFSLGGLPTTWGAAFSPCALVNRKPRTEARWLAPWGCCRPPLSQQPTVRSGEAVSDTPGARRVPPRSQARAKPFSGLCSGWTPWPSG